ncbi:hypothetical protein [Streptomyces sp. LN499]|uniref:hypothetical protein n=1 Tax=Streptomyces sp. LN499 TaxID=3112977 RepID=UPI00371CC420
MVGLVLDTQSVHAAAGVPPGTPAARRLKGSRQDGESIHSRFDQAYSHERVPEYGPAEPS